MEDWAAAAEPVGGWRGGEGKLLRTEIFVPFLVPNIEWIKICKTGGLLGPQPRTPMSPPSPRVTKVCLDLACWTRFPPLRKQPPGAEREMVRPEHPRPQPPPAPAPHPHPRPTARALPDRVLGGARRPGRALSNVQGKSPSNSKQDDSCNIPGPGAVGVGVRGRAEPAARGRRWGTLPAGRGRGGRGGVSCRPAA